jgi:hypothetical protein
MVFTDFVKAKIASLPDGPVWMTGHWLKEFLTQLLSDRARTDPATLNEAAPDGTGRVFSVKPANASVAYPFQEIDASAVGPTPGQLQVRSGTVAGVYPTSMGNDGTSPFYLQLSNGTNYILCKVAVNSDGTWGALTVYKSLSAPTADGNFIYGVIGTASFDGTKISGIVNYWKGAQNALALSSADGTILYGFFSPLADS